MTSRSAAPAKKPAPAIPGVGAGAPKGGVLPGLAAFGKMQGMTPPVAANAPKGPPAPPSARAAASAPRAPKAAPVMPAPVMPAPVMPVPEPVNEYQEAETYSADAAESYSFQNESFAVSSEDQQDISYADGAEYDAEASEFNFSDEDLDALIREGAEAQSGEHALNGAEGTDSADEAIEDLSGYEQEEERTDAPAFVFEDEQQDGEGNGLASAYKEESYDEDLSHRALKTFEAGYDGPPEINLGDYSGNEDEDAPQPFFEEGAEGDAAFLEQEFDAAAVPPVKEGRGRKYMMVASALVGALALGGAFAFAYKTGGGAGDSQPPLIQADARPAKVAPAEPGGKEFPHKNKLIYERLNGAGEPAGNERLVPRQEQVAETPPALRPGEGQRQAALMPATGDKPQQPTAAVPAEAPEAPRKVRTLLVRPDGTLVQPAAEQAAAEQPAPAQAAPAPSPVASAEPAPAAAPLPLPPATAAPGGAPSTLQRPASSEPVRPVVLGAAPTATAEPAPAAAAPAAQVPPPLSKPSPPPVAVASAPAAPAPQASAGDSTYVVQVAARKSQADALAAFADLQQKYPDLLSGYRPMIQRADLGDRGVWYRLRVGPMQEKTAAADLCTKLKGAGIGSCLVREE